MLRLLPAAHNHSRRLAIESHRHLWQSSSMDKTEVLQTLRRHEPELKAAGVVHLRLFGSVARGENSAQSDVDLMAEFDSAKRLTLVTMAHLENRLSDLLGAKVDLAPFDSMRETVRTRALREAVHAF
jgi:predicted nucleotidyltransferase